MVNLASINWLHECLMMAENDVIQCGGYTPAVIGGLTHVALIYNVLVYLCKWIHERSYSWTVEKDMNVQCMIDHGSYTHKLSSCEIKAWKNSGLNGIRTHGLCDTGAVLYQLSFQAIWELVTLWVYNIPIEGEGCKWMYERSYIWTVEKDMNLWGFNQALISQLLKLCL